jgi:hypothetical protein
MGGGYPLCGETRRVVGAGDRPNPPCIAAGSNGAVLTRRTGACWQNDQRLGGAICAHLRIATAFCTRAMRSDLQVRQLALEAKLAELLMVKLKGVEPTGERPQRAALPLHLPRVDRHHEPPGHPSAPAVAR